MRMREIITESTLLLEYRTDVTVQKQGDALKQAAHRVERNTQLTPEQIVQGLEKMDPTKKKNYMMWIIRQYLAGKMRLEDHPRVRDALSEYHTAKPQLPVEQRDIGKFDLHSLEELVDGFDQSTDVQAKTQEKFQHLDDMEILYDGPKGLLAIPKTQKASCELGSGTKWCTASKQNNMFDHYSEDGALYVFVERPGNAKYQFHFESGQFMDARDVPVDKNKINYFRTQHPVTKKLFNHHEKKLAQHPERAYWYTRDVIRGRWPPGEPAIAQAPQWAYWYARNLIQGRWPPGEPAIAQAPQWAYLYAREVIQGRWPEAEPQIAQDPEQAYWYAWDVIGGRWPEAEPVIAQDPELAYWYARDVVGGKFP